jgi:hypothetical protein
VIKEAKEKAEADKKKLGQVKNKLSKLLPKSYTLY